MNRVAGILVALLVLCSFGVGTAQTGTPRGASGRGATPAQPGRGTAPTTPATPGRKSPGAGPVIVVGSSLGGWLALLLAQRRPQRVAGLVLLAPAPDFPDDIWNLEFGEEERRHVEKTGMFYRPSNYGDPYPLTRALFQDAKNHLLLDKRSVYPCAIHILHGKADPDVPWQKSERIMEQSMAPSIRVTWIDDGDHRLSRDQDLKLLDDTVVEMLRLPRIEAAK